MDRGGRGQRRGGRGNDIAHLPSSRGCSRRQASHRPAAQARPDPPTGTESRANRATLHPKAGALAAVELSLGTPYTHVVASADPPSEAYVTVREPKVAVGGPRLHSEREQVVDAFTRHAAHRAGTPSASAATDYATRDWHTGHTTATTDINVLHRGQWTAFPCNPPGIQSGGGGAGATVNDGPSADVGGGTAGAVASGAIGGGAGETTV